MKSVFATMLLSGALLTALWTDVRLRFAAPANALAGALHVGAAGIAVALAPSGMDAVLTLGESPLVASVATLGVFFPALVYFFVSSVWLLRAMRTRLAG